MNVLRSAGMIKKLARLLSPFLRCFFSDAYKKGVGCSEISASISANILGIGNAATPIAICAMKKLRDINPDKITASSDMITLAVLNTASFSLVPTTVLALRRAAGSADPLCVVVPIWITSFCTSAFALVLCRAMSMGKKD
jgi:spore maturation protein A